MKPIVTIGVCVKNCESTISSVIQSIVIQDFCHNKIEVIFVDDGSADGTLKKILEAIPKMGMKVKVFSSEWRGLGSARNTVVKNARGDYIVWVDGDMILPKDFVRKQVEFMEQIPKVGIGKGKYGMYNRAKLVTLLENIESIIDDLQHEGKAAKPLGTGGSIYRVEAIRQVGGFDENIKGVGEDMDAELRIMTAGWLLCKTPAIFYERRRETLKGLWDEYYWYGYGNRFVFHKNKTHTLNVIRKMFPPAAILIEFSRSRIAYKLTNRKVVFLLPFHWIFKRIAWSLGFVRSYIKTISRRNYRNEEKNHSVCSSSR